MKELRKRAGLTQEQLASGICSPVSVSRIENGSQMPSQNVLDALLSRLGTSTYGLCGVFYKSERQLEFDRRAEQADKLFLSGELEKAEAILRSIEEASLEDTLARQHFLMIDAAVKLAKSELEEALNELQTALELTKPGIDPADLRGVLLSYREANILSLMMSADFNCGRQLRAIEIGKALISSLEAQDSLLKEHRLVMISVLVNMSQLMENNEWHAEAADYIEKAERISLENQEHLLLPEILLLKAKNFHNRGRDDEGARILTALIPYMELIGKKDFAEKGKALLDKLKR